MHRNIYMYTYMYVYIYIHMKISVIMSDKTCEWICNMCTSAGAIDNNILISYYHNIIISYYRLLQSIIRVLLLICLHTFV